MMSAIGEPADLRRQAMLTNMTQRNVPKPKLKQMKSKLKTQTKQQKYLNCILHNWRGEPEELFEIKNWMKWTKDLANSNGEAIQNKSVRKHFADELVELMCDSKYSYLHKLRDKLDGNQWKRLLKLKEVHEQTECLKLAELSNGHIDLESSAYSIFESSDDDECVHDNVPVALNGNMVPIPVKWTTETNCNMNDLYFQDLNIPAAAVSGFSNGCLDSRKPNRILPKSRNQTLTSPTPPVKAKRKKIFLTNQEICEIVAKTPSTTSYEFECSVIHPENYEDEVIENPTPPCSPVCTGDVECVEITARSNVSNNVVNENDLVISRPVKREDAACSSNAQRLKYGDSKLLAENRKIKGLGLRAYPQASYPGAATKIVDNKAAYDDDNFDLPDIDPPVVDQDKENCPISVDEIATRYPNPPSAPMLTLEILQKIEEAMERSPKDHIVSGFSLNILQEDLAIFNKDTEWLIDRNIDFYMELIKARSTHAGYPRVYIFPSFFYTLLANEDGGYDAVQDTTGQDDIFMFDLVFFPINLSHHWRLVVAEFSTKSLMCYDSMHHDNADVLKHIGKYIKEEYRRLYRKRKPEEMNLATARDYFTSPQWNVENVSSDRLPQQKNGNDCGVFLLQYAEYLSRRQEFDFDQTHIPYFRKRMLFETMTKQLLTSHVNEAKSKVTT